MPRGDGTGPWGLGPMTGRGAGFCAGYRAPRYMNFGGRGLGFGRGRGNRRMWWDRRWGDSRLCVPRLPMGEAQQD